MDEKRTAQTLLRITPKPSRDSKNTTQGICQRPTSSLPCVIHSHRTPTQPIATTSLKNDLPMVWPACSMEICSTSHPCAAGCRVCVARLYKARIRDFYAAHAAKIDLPTSTRLGMLTTGTPRLLSCGESLWPGITLPCPSIPFGHFLHYRI